MLIILSCFFGIAAIVLLVLAVLTHLNFLNATAEPPARSIFRSPIRLFFSNAHWHSSMFFKKYMVPGYCAHSPQVWPWWRLVSFRVVRLEIALPSHGWRLWVYTRWGALYWDLTVDRRMVRA